MLNVSFICDKTSPGKGGMIGTVYRNSSSSTNNNYLAFQIFPRRSCEPQVQERTCPTRTYVCLAKHHSKQPIGAPRLNLVPASPKLYKVVFYNVLVGIPTYKVTTTVLVLNSKESTTAYSAYTAYTTVLVDSKDRRHIVIGLVQ